MSPNSNYHVAVIGAGPAGIFAARALAKAGIEVALLNQHIRPGGLAEYGIYHTKHRLKAGLRKQFIKALEHTAIHYFGNVAVGEGKDISLERLQAMGFDALLVTTGSQSPRRIGIPNEYAKGAYHASEIYYYYNGLPPYSQQAPEIGDRVLLIGIGNVMVDIATYLVTERKVKSVTAVARCGPCEIKFAKKEFMRIAANLDVDDFEQETKRIAKRLQEVGENLEGSRAFILSAYHHAEPTDSPTRFTFRFLSLPYEVLTNAEGRVKGLKVEDTYLVFTVGKRPIPYGLGTFRTLEADTIIYCVGTKADPSIGLPVWRDSFATAPRPRYPVHHTSYEAYNPQEMRFIEGVFLAGWARRANFGLVGAVRKDGELAAEAVLRYLAEKETSNAPSPLGALGEHLKSLEKPIADKAAWQRLLEAEAREAEKRGAPGFRFTTNEEMLKAAGLA